MKTSSKPAMPTMSPSRGAFDLDLLQPFMAENRGDVRAGFPAVAVKANDALSDFDPAADDAPVGDAAEVVAVVEIRDEQLEIVCVRLLRRGNVLDDGLEERIHGLAGIVQFPLGEALLRAGVDDAGNRAARRWR